MFLFINKTLPREKNFPRNVLGKANGGVISAKRKTVIVRNACEAPLDMRVPSPCSVLHCKDSP